MTRKDYIAIAAILKEAMQERGGNTEEAKTTVDYIAGRIAAVCAADNANFDPKRFFTACGLYAGK